MHVTSATYYTAGDSYTPLLAMNIDKMDYENPSWRDQQGGQPYTYYENGPNFGLYLKPSLATGVGGYPKVTIYYTQKNVTGMAVALPAQVLNYDAWVCYMLREFCRKRHPSDFPKYDQALSMALNDLLNYQQARLVRDKPEVINPIPFPTNR